MDVALNLPGITKYSDWWNSMIMQFSTQGRDAGISGNIMPCMTILISLRLRKSMGKVKGENEPHRLAKAKVMLLAYLKGYEVYPEYDTEDFCHYRGRDDVSFPIDCYLVKNEDKIYVQVDGPIHSNSIIQAGKTDNRNESLLEYCYKNRIRYVVLNKDDTLMKDNNKQIYEKLGII